jgi:capsular exopolysaccharide synthesis family protein
MTQKALDMDGSLLTPASETVSVSPDYGFSGEVTMLADPKGARAESIRTLRTHIMAQHLEGGRRGLAICAASAGAGATFVAVNLAVALAQVGVKVLLIDGDLRNPQLENFIRPPQTVPGLRQCLEGDGADLSENIQADVITNLSVMFSGGAAGNAQELLSSDRFQSVMKRCLRDFDLTVIDTPAANTCADARRISTVAGYSLIVAKRDLTYVADLKALAAQLRDDRAHVIGSVMSGV